MLSPRMLSSVHYTLGENEPQIEGSHKKLTPFSDENRRFISVFRTTGTQIARVKKIVREKKSFEEKKIDGVTTA